MWLNGPLTRYAKLRVAHAPRMPGTFSRHRLQRKPLVSDPGMRHGTCVTHVPWCISGSLTRGGGKNFPGIPGACANRKFTYLVRGPLQHTRRHNHACELTFVSVATSVYSNWSTFRPGNGIGIRSIIGGDFRYMCHIRLLHVSLQFNSHMCLIKNNTALYGWQIQCIVFRHAFCRKSCITNFSKCVIK